MASGASRAGCAQGCRDTAPIVADGADGADGIFERSMYRDDPGADTAFPTERNLDAQYPQEGLRATQAASERAGVFGPGCTVPRGAVTASGAETQKVGSATCPRAALGQDLAHTSGNWVGVDTGFDRGPAV